MTPEWSTACPDWQKRIVEGRSLIPFPPLFADEASAALEILRSLRIVDAAGSPEMGAACREWVFEFAAAIFGAYDASSGRRLIRNFFQLIGKKNSKSTTAAAIMLTALMRNWRKSAEFLIVAPTIEVASNSFIPASDMVAADSDLRDMLHVQPNTRTIKHLNTGATLKVIAADNETVSGKKAVGVLIDELWLFGKRANAENILREATGGLAARPEGFVIYLSTQSDEPPAGVFKQTLDRFRDIRDGKIADKRSLGVLYEYPQAMIVSGEYLEPKNFYIPNPNLGASVDLEYLKDELATAKRNGAQSLCGFAAKHLNVEIGINLRSNRWTGTDHWERRADPSITLDAMLDRCEVIVVGIDGGGLDDLFGLTVLGREHHEVEVEAEESEDGQEKPRRREKRWLSWSHAWCHEGVLERRKTIANVLQEFTRDGDLTIVGDELADLGEIVAIIERIREAGLLYCVAVDPAGLGEIVDALAEIDVTQENKENGRNFLIGVSQGYALMNAIKTAERRLARGSLLHADQPLMNWCVSNLKIEATRTAIMATKQNAGDAKIDPAFALFDAVTVMSMNPDSARSAYEDKPLLVL